MLKRKLINEQQSDPELTQLFNQAKARGSADNISKTYYIRNDALMPTKKLSQIPNSEHWITSEKIVIPRAYSRSILKTSHEIPLAGHFGINKSCEIISRHLHFSRVKKDLAKFCKTCFYAKWRESQTTKPKLHPYTLFQFLKIPPLQSRNNKLRRSIS